jgi:selenobiotic family peptide radical SAM maturase
MEHRWYPRSSPQPLATAIVNASLAAIYPISYRLAGEPSHTISPPDFPQYLSTHPDCCAQHPFLPDLASLEYAGYQLSVDPIPFQAMVHERTINPTVRILEVEWTGLPEFLHDQSFRPHHQQALVLLYQSAPHSTVQIRTPHAHDLLALKIVMEDIGSKDAAAEAGVTIGSIDALLAMAAQRGLILTPPSTLIRDESFLHGPFADPEQSRVATFALQWHLTQACDLHCRHCYDRSSRTNMEFAQALHVLDELYAFSQAHHVNAQVSFTGGNPMLYPFFYEVYQEAVDRGFLVAILGNPMEERYIERLLTIKRPEFYQVSLEGLRDHNDYIRGAGHYDRVLNFLELLRAYDIYSMVMLTLTRANSPEVLALAEELRGRVDLFTFNRLAMVGEGAELASLKTDDFPQLLDQFLAAAANNDILSLKDNFFNLLLSERQQPLTGGCTGFGCGAAFNFVSVLPDGEVHACRKFPSLIGNIFTQSLANIYAGEQAEKYRTGSSDCFDCEIRPVCRGCLAVAHGFGLNVFTDRDPYCFKDNRGPAEAVDND